MKAITILVTAICLTGSLFTSGFVSAVSDNQTDKKDFMYGDINSDGYADLTDLTTLSIYLMEKSGLDEIQLKAADVDGNNEVDISDLAHYKRYICKENVVLGPNEANSLNEGQEADNTAPGIDLRESGKTMDEIIAEEKAKYSDSSQDHFESGSTDDDYYWECWNLFDEGKTEMTAGNNGTFKCSWEKTLDTVFNFGKKFSSVKNWKDYGPVVIKYDADYKASGVSFFGAYGWSEYPLAEYYVTEGWTSWRPPGNSVTALGSVASDGKKYDIYKLSRIYQPSIHGTESFDQYWSVVKENPLTENKETNVKGTITLSNHFAAWEDLDMEVGKLYDAAFNINGYTSSGNVNANEVKIITGYFEADQ